MKLIPIIASKGGVGKSLVVINTAYGLMKLGYKTGLLDLDLSMPAVVKYLNLHGQDPGTSKLLDPINIQGVQIISAGLIMDKDQPVTIDSNMRRGFVQQFIGKTSWDVDYLIVDTPPASNEELSEIIKLYREDILGFIVVTTPSSTAINEVRRSLEYLRRNRLPLLGIIGNMVGFECGTCHSMNSLFNNGHVNPIDELAGDFKTRVITNLPMYPSTDDEPLHFVDLIQEGLKNTQLF